MAQAEERIRALGRVMMGFSWKDGWANDLTRKCPMVCDSSTPVGRVKDTSMLGSIDW